MIYLGYDNITQILYIHNQYNVDMKLDIWVKDIETNLYGHNFWVALPPNNHVNYDFKGNFPIYSNGAIFEVYYEGDIIAEEKHVWGEINNYPKFSTPLQTSYIHWWDLLSKPTLSITDQDVVYDLGANYGTFSMWAKNAKQVYAFEPTPSIIPYLKDTFKNEKNIEIFDKAISAHHNTIVPFNIYPWHSSNSIVDIGLEGGETVDVETINLEEFVKENNLLPPTIIKCDIEGLEDEFINSLSDEFFETINQINLEFHYLPYEKFGKLLTRFLKLGYTISLKEEMNEKRMMGTINLLKTNIRINE